MTEDDKKRRNSLLSTLNFQGGTAWRGNCATNWRRRTASP